MIGDWETQRNPGTTREFEYHNRGLGKARESGDHKRAQDHKGWGSHGGLGTTQ